LKTDACGIKSSASETIYTEFYAVGNVTKHRQVSEPGTLNEQTYLMEYSFDLAGNMRTQKYPSGITIETEFDAAGSIAGVKNPDGGYFAGGAPSDDVNRIQYTAHGAMSDLRLGNGLWEHTIFNERLQPVEIGLGTQKSSNDRLKLAYSYGTTNNNGNVQSQTITVPTINSIQGTTLTQAYSYDALNCLLSASEAGGANPWTQSYTYSNPDGTGGQFGNRRIDAGNTTPILLPASNSTFNPVNNRFSPGQGYEYDAAGNLKNSPGFSFTYDSENRQVSANDGQAGGLSSYSYDGDGRRVRKITATNTITVFVYNLAGQMVAEYSTSNLTTSGGTSYLTMDTLGTPRIISGSNIFNSTGGVKARHDYLPFGEEIALSGGRTEAQGYVVDSLKQKFTGYERDNETGLDYAQARYYASAQGRFTSADPLMASATTGNPQSWKHYTRNNPLKYIDY
jgi:RHS repeat-associated protein